MKQLILFSLVLGLTIAEQTYNIKYVENKDMAELANTELVKDQPVKLDKAVELLKFHNLHGTIYKDCLAQVKNVKYLEICQCQIDGIESGAFCAIPGLELIKFRHSKLPKITKTMFDGCSNLRVLKSEGDSIEIASDALTGLANLKKFDLKPTNWQHLKAEQFGNLVKLEELRLVSCKIKQIDQNAFKNLKNLEEINLSDNEIANVDDIFVGLAKLESLKLNDNKLTNLSCDEFKGLNNLEYLNLSGNRISTLDSTKISNNLPHLRKLILYSTDIPCEQLKNIEQNLKKTNHKIKVKYTTC